MKKVILSTAILLLSQQSLEATNIGTAGDVVQVILPAVAYGTTLYLDDDEGQMQFYKSFGTNLAITYALKYGVNKTRPNGGKHSFPSGHTSSSFQAASFIHKRYGLNYAIPAYLSATFVGYSRVESKAHYTSDIIAGAALGALSSFYFTTHYKEVEIKPIVMNQGGYGIGISSTW